MISNLNNSGSSGGNGINGRSRSRDKPPKLPPREHSAAAIYGPALWAKPGDGGGKAGHADGGMGRKMSGEGGRTKTGNEKKGGGERYEQSPCIGANTQRVKLAVHATFRDKRVSLRVRAQR